MKSLRSAAFLSVALLTLAGCSSKDSTGPTPVPAAISRSAGDAQTGTVGATLPNQLAARVVDASGAPIANARVQWEASAGSGAPQPGVSFTNRDGIATTQWVLGPIAGTARMAAQVGGVNPTVFTATALPGPVAVIVSLPDVATIGVGDTLRIRSTVRDQFGNEVPGQVVSYSTPDASTASVSNTGLVTALALGTARIIATANSRADTALLTIAAPGASPCGSTPVTTLQVGEVFNPAGGTSGTRVCVAAPAGSTADFGLVLVSAAPSYTSTLVADLFGLGVNGPTSANFITAAASHGIAAQDGYSARQFRPLTDVRSAQPVPLSLDGVLLIDRNAERERRAMERRELGGLRDVAREAYAARSAARMRGMQDVAGAVHPGEVHIGDLLRLNANALSACESPNTRIGRVAAIGTRSIIVSDTANPAGGYTDTEYAAIAATFDTLIYPMVTEAFGTPTDISGYGKTILFYTRVVNSLTPPNSGFVIGGFFFARDLYPKTARSGLPACAASNEAEMMYLLVPDPNATINNNRRTKDDVSRLNIGTIAHEYQHLINSSRRLYVNTGAVQAEETWLDEGLSHVAEELLYLRLSGYGPRQNLNIQDVAGNSARSATFSNYGIQNFGRLYEYLRNPEANSPYALNDSLSTRGAIWSFLRYAGMREGIGNEAAFFRRLVNSTTAGQANLQSAVPANQFAEYLRDWSISNLADDYSTEVMTSLQAQYINPTWNFRSIFPALRIGGQTLNVYPLATRSLFDNIPQRVNLPGGATSYIRFSVPGGRQGLVSLSSNGSALPGTARVGVVRLR